MVNRLHLLRSRLQLFAFWKVSLLVRSIGPLWGLHFSVEHFRLFFDDPRPGYFVDP